MKILILRFSSIGDIVLTTPVMRCIKTQMPNSEIHYFTKNNFASLLENNPYIDKIWKLNSNENELIKALKKEKYDVIIDLHNNLRTLKIKLNLFSVKRYSVDKNNLKKWRMVKLKSKISCSHIVERYLETCSALNVKNDGQGLDFFIDSKHCLPSNILSEIENKTFTVFAIGGTYATKRLPAHKILELLLKSKDNVVLIGDKKDANNLKTIEEKFPNNVINLCGQLSLQESAMVIQHAEKVIAHDSGFMHIAAALKKPVISYWGNTVPEFGMGPYFPDNKEELNLSKKQVELSCRPCSKLGFNECPKGHFKCMEMQEV